MDSWYVLLSFALLLFYCVQVHSPFQTRSCLLGWLLASFGSLVSKAMASPHSSPMMNQPWADVTSPWTFARTYLVRPYIRRPLSENASQGALSGLDPMLISTPFQLNPNNEHEVQLDSPRRNSPPLGRTSRQPSPTLQSPGPVVPHRRSPNQEQLQPRLPYIYYW